MVKASLLAKYLISMTSFWVITICTYAHDNDFRTRISDPQIKTLSVTNPDNFMGNAVIRLNSDDRLCFNFDLIGDSHEYLRYRVVHCNSDWQPSRLLESETIDGFNEAEITDFAYSSNTYTHYVNYNLILPNEDIRFLASGNYLLQVFREDNPDQTILQARFSVAENAATIAANVTTSTDRGLNTEWQQLSIDLDFKGIKIDDPFRDIKLEITQNNDPATTRILTAPQRAEPGHLVYAHTPALIFPAGNEFRRFETVRLDYPGMHTDSVAFINNIWNAFLTPDNERAESAYSYDRTQFGRFKIDEYNASDPNLGADYVVVYFTLDIPEMSDTDIFLSGDFTLRLPSDQFKMVFDRSQGSYKAAITMKQGSYNYQYVAKPKYNHDIQASPTLIEGNFYETRNEYQVKVFYTPPESRGDRLIGYATIEQEF